MIAKAAANFHASCHILRIGQIVCDRASGQWNDSEAIPLMIRSAFDYEGTTSSIRGTDIELINSLTNCELLTVSPEMLLTPLRFSHRYHARPGEPVDRLSVVYALSTPAQLLPSQSNDLFMDPRYPPPRTSG
jgi:hypothetical protein